MTDNKDPPIVAQNYLGGVKVIDIGDIRVSRGLSRRPFSSCKHRNILYDQAERRIWCSDCETTIEPFDAFLMYTEMIHFAAEEHDRREQRLAEAEAHSIRSLAAREIDKAWSSRRMIPSCPHCQRGLMPEDFKSGVKSLTGRQYEMALRNKEKSKP